jgi:hypothetical protein
MKRRFLFFSVVLLAVVASSCSAGFSRPRAVSLVEGDDVVYALVDPDPNRNTPTTVPSLLRTPDGRSWEPVVGDRSLPTEVGIGLNETGVAQECDEGTGTCYRIISPAKGIRLEVSNDAGATWQEVWSISAGRIDFQNRCCGTRNFAIRDLEYAPNSGLVAVALAEYGLLTLGTDAEIRLDSLGRSDRPTSGLMVGLFVEPLFAAAIALAIGWITTEQRLSRLRDELEKRFGSDEHSWLTDRTRQIPILLPLVFFIGMAGALAAFWRLTQAAEGDPPHTTGWVTLALAALAIAAISGLGLVLHHRKWQADDETRARAHFAVAARSARRAQIIGAISAVLAFAAMITPLVAWTTGGIDSFADAYKVALGAGAGVGAAFWIWEASHPPLSD